MEKSLHAHQNRITHLEYDEIENPIKVIGQFFMLADLYDHLKMLKQWRNAIAFESRNTRNITPSNLLYLHDVTMKLIEAAWLLKDQELGEYNMEDKIESDLLKLYIKTERKQSICYPKTLKLRQKLNPQMIITDTFKTYSLNDYRRILEVWLYDALSFDFSEESLTKSDVIIVYERIVALFEATYLINVRFRMSEKSEC